MTFRAAAHAAQLEGNPIHPDVEWDDNFLDASTSLTADLERYHRTITELGAGSATFVILDNNQGGVLRLLNAAGDNDEVNLVTNGGPFIITQGDDVIFSTRIRVADVSETDWMVGLVSPGTTDALGGIVEFIGFRCPDSSGDIDIVTEDASTETVTDSGVNIEDATFVILSFRVISNNRVKFYIDGVFVGQHVTNIPDGDDLALGVHVRNDGAVAQSLDLDWLYCLQLRV